MKKITQAQARELLENLKYAVKVAKWCHTHHPDIQKGDGIPAFLIWEELISRVEAAP